MMATKQHKHLFSSSAEYSVVLGEYILENHATLRSTAKFYGISKSLVHYYIEKHLLPSNNLLYAEVRKVLDKNKAEKHLRGGESTRQKYLLISKHKADTGAR